MWHHFHTTGKSIKDLTPLQWLDNKCYIYIGGNYLKIYFFPWCFSFEQSFSLYDLMDYRESTFIIKIRQYPIPNGWIIKWRGCTVNHFPDQLAEDIILAIGYRIAVFMNSNHSSYIKPPYSLRDGIILKPFVKTKFFLYYSVNYSFGIKAPNVLFSGPQLFAVRWKRLFGNFTD